MSARSAFESFQASASVHGAFELWAERTPEQTAIRDGSASITYGELNAHANRLAGRLREVGVRREECVGVVLPRSTEAIVAFIAILKLSAAYVPIDSSYPPGRIEAMLRAAGARVIVAVPGAAGLPAGLHVVAVDEEAVRSLRATGNVMAASTPDDLAYVMFTSGSTGPPKGVLIPHCGIRRLVIDANYIAVGPGDVVAHAATIAFDASTFEIWLALLNGACLAIVTKQTLLDPIRLEETIERDRITVLFLTTSMFVRLVHARPTLFRHLAYLLIGGEALPAAAIRTLFSGARPERVLNVYGPTEATSFASFYPIESSPATEDSISIGRAISETTLHVLDDRLRPVVRGAAGQLFIGGRGLALGYLDDADLTRKKFVRNPGGHGALYATGDLVCESPSGDLRYLGRLDEQRKVRGFRIEPAEIEAQLAAHPSIAQARIVFSDEAAELRIIAYVQARDDVPFESGCVEAYLRERLPDFMIPHVIVPVHTFPLTPNGKLDVRALPIPRRPVDESVRLAPRNDVERSIVAVWERVLDVRPIGIRDDFFSVGGTSLSAVTMMSELEVLFGASLSIERLFHEPTVEMLASTLTQSVCDDVRRPMLELNDGGCAPPLVFLHGAIFGGGFYCRTLARCLGPNQPLWLMEPLGVDEAGVPESIGQIADRYIARLRARQPRGAYRLGGYSAGGLVAFEMARKLRAAGDSVANVILIDPPVPIASLRWFRAPTQAIAERLDTRWRWLGASLRHAARLPHHIDRLRSDAPRRRMVCAAPLRPRSPDENQRLDEVLRRWIRACEGYVPTAYPGAVTLLFTRESMASAVAPGDWLRVAPTAYVDTIAGDHFTCVTRYADEVAAQVKRAFSRDR